jgi:uncharacterized protein (TIGR03067 family)
MTRFHSLGATLLVFAGASGRADTQLARPADLVLDGTYTVVSGEKGGNPVPDEKIKGSVVKFTKDTIVGTDKDRKEFFSAKFSLDTSATPAQIKMNATTPKEASALGLIKKENGVVTIVYALPGSPAPTEFKTKEGQHLFVLKPAPAGEKPPQ